MRAFLGCFTTHREAETGASGIGILDDHGGTLTMRPGPDVVNPTYLALASDRRVLYTVMGVPAGGAVGAFKIDDDNVVPHGLPQLTGGTRSCHLSVHPSGSLLLSADYAEGSIAVHRITDDASLGPRVDLVEMSGSGPDPQRQQGPHPHMIVTDPTGTYILVTDLGTDSVYRYTLKSGRLDPAGVASLSPGAGPRHLAFHPALPYAYIANELNSTVTVLDLAIFTVGDSFSTVPPGTQVRSLPSAIRITSDGRFCYVANRGPDTIGLLAVADDGAALSLVTAVPCGGRHPRDMIIDGEYLYVANQLSDVVTGFRVNAETGVPAPHGTPLPTAAPSCIVFA